MSDLKKILAVFLALALLAMALTLFFDSSNATRKPELTLTYLYQTNDSSGQTIALFAITNTGYSTLLNTTISYFEFTSATNLKRSANVRIASIRYLKFPLSDTNSRLFFAQTTLHKTQLSHGEGDVITVRIPSIAEGRWRLKCYFAEKGIRFWIAQQSWKQSWSRFVPKILRTTPVNITATSDWIDPQKTEFFEIPEFFPTNFL